MQVDDKGKGKPSFVSPGFAAGAFGFMAVFFACLAGLGYSAELSPTAPPPLMAGSSFATMCVPCVYFAVRGFRAGRTDVFQDLPQTGVIVIAITLGAFGVALGAIGGDSALTAFPLVAASCFAVCNHRLRRFEVKAPWELSNRRKFLVPLILSGRIFLVGLYVSVFLPVVP